MILDALHYDAFAQFDTLYINTLNFIYKIFRSIYIENSIILRHNFCIFNDLVNDYH
jgi:hypothetical protein